MATRNWRYYTEPGTQEIKLGRFASGEYDTKLVRGDCANYAETRRNVLNLVYNIETSKVPLVGPESDEWWQWVDIPIGGRITRPGQLRIYLLTESTVEGGANEIDCQAYVGRDAMHVDVSNAPAPGAVAHKLITVDLTGSVSDPGDRLKLLFRTSGVNNINIYGVSCYQPQIAAAPEFVDLDDAACVLGDADYPDSVRTMELLRDNTVSVRGHKVPKNNVWQQWFALYYKNDANYSQWAINNNDLGDYRFAKRAGVSEVKCHFYAYETSGVAGCDVRMEIADPLAALVNPILAAAAQTQVVIGGPNWYTITWTFQGVDIDNEYHLQLYIDGRDVAGGGTETVYVPGVYLVETAPAAAIAHTVPDTLNTKMHSDILASTHDNARTTLNHLYYQSGKQILIGDWRFSAFSSSTPPWTFFTTQFLCQNGWAENFFGDPAVFNNSCAARGLLFSSTGSTKLRTRFEYSTDLVVNKTKQIQIALDDTFPARTVANYYEADPMYDLATNNIHDITRVIDKDVRRYMGVERCELEIRAADWEEHWDGAGTMPPCVHVNCKSDAGGATGYIIPIHFSCEEISLHPTEFP